ncbi:hypothetical protein R80B4_00958 [Fibrobacteres bacterium R8-0-B4]
MSISDFVKDCVSRKDGRMVCWDADDEGFVLLEIKKMPISAKDLTEGEIIEIMKKNNKK